MELLPLKQSAETATTQDKPTRDAGEFITWLSEIEASAAHDTPINVPCDTCSACCQSGYFIRIAKSETQAIASIPAALLFPAPGDKNAVVMGFDNNGCCPMFKEGACTIYDNRPNTCRTFDCRIFSGCNLEAGEAHPKVSNAANEWQFQYADANSSKAHQALLTAAHFIATHFIITDGNDIVPADTISTTSKLTTSDPNASNLYTSNLQLALLALRCHKLFLQTELPTPDAMVKQINALLSANP